MRRAMRILPLIVSPWLAALVFWLLFGACLSELPDGDPAPPAARLLTTWDPLACGEPHRVVVELEDDDGVAISASAPCWLGGVTLDAPRWGVYRGRVYGWELGEVVRAVVPVELTVDAPVVRWHLTSPP